MCDMSRHTLQRMIEMKRDEVRSAEIVALLEEHLHDMYATSPAESVHALDLERLRAPDIMFWCAWSDGQLAGCGALKRLSDNHLELKSMRTSSHFKRRGIATLVLQHLIVEARALAATRLSLETGTMTYFAPARALYLKHGFSECPP